MAGTAAAIFLLPGDVSAVSPYAHTPEGQYLVKNLVLAAAALVTGSMARGGRVVPNTRDTRPPHTHARRRRVDRMRAPFPPEVLAFLLLGWGAVSSSVTGDCFEANQRGGRAETLRDVGSCGRLYGQLPAVVRKVKC
jgi:hypothetical protein